MMGTVLLFVSVVLVWGLTWFVMHAQLGGVAVDVAVFWRMAGAAVMLGLWLGARGKLRRPPSTLAIWLVALGLCLFSANFLLLYRSAAFLPSGTVSVIFSLATVLNALNLWVFFGQRPAPRIVVGGLLGAAGIALLLGGGGGHRTADIGAVLHGVALALGGTFLFSLGNMVTRRIGQDTLASVLRFDLANVVFYAMLAGSVFTALLAGLRGEDFSPPRDPSWLAGLAFLSLFGSVIGFVAYLSLVHRIGADKAAYTTILAPVMAIGISTLLEGLAWSIPMFLGLILILSGNLVAFRVRLLRRPASAG